LEINIDEDEIYDIADSSAIADRGWRYYKSGNVNSLRVDGNSISAEVSGSNIYDVEIDFDDDGGIEDYYCDCPYDGEGCKHVVAVLYCILEKKSSKFAFEIKDLKFVIQEIELDEIIKKAKKEEILRGIEIFENEKIKLKKNNSKKYSAKIKENTVNIFSTYNGFQSTCQCEKIDPNKLCSHEISLILSLISEYGKKDIHAFKNKIIKEIDDANYNKLVKSMDLIEDNNNNNNNNHIFFEFENDKDKLELHLKKAKRLKNGGLGIPTNISRKGVEDLIKDVPKNKKELILLLSESIKNEYDHFYENKIIKKEFKSLMDLEFLKKLREYYKQDKTSISNFKIEPSGNQIEIRINNRSEKGNILEVGVETINGFKDLKNAIIKKLGEDSVWYFIKEEGWYNVGEINSDYISNLTNLIKCSGMTLSEEKLNSFIDKYYMNASQIGKINLPDNYEIIKKEIKPIPCIFLKDYSEMFSIKLKFNYGEKMIEYGSNENLVYKEEDKIIEINRDKEGEQYYHNMLFDYHIYENNGILIPSIDPYEWLADYSKELISKGYEIYGEENLFNYKISKEEPQLRIEVSSGIDWFDLKGEVSIGEESIPFQELLNNLSHGERFIKLSDGKIGVIPKKWINKLSGVAGLLKSNSEKDVKASRTQISIIEEILEISTEAKVDQKFSEIREKFKKFKDIREVPLPKGLNGELRSYQKAGYNWLNFLNEFSFGGCLADEMGLGKTIQTLTLLLNEKEKGNKVSSLVVVPKSLVFNWVNEIKKFTPDLSFYVHHGSERLNNKTKFKKIKEDIIITTYGTLVRDIKLFQQCNYHYIVLDESQKIKNPLSKITRNIYTVKSNHRLILSGTPIENRSMELWSQFAFINPGLLGGIDYFKKTFTKTIDVNRDKTKMESLKNIVNPFILLRKKEDVEKDLPEKQITTLFCDMSEEQREVYDYWKEKYKSDILESIKVQGLMKSRFKILQGLTMLRQICNHPVLIDQSFKGNSDKFKVIINHINEIIEEGHKVLIFSSFVKMLKVFKKYFEENNVSFSYLDGSTRNRENVVNEFQNNKDINTFLISLKAGGLGLNLTSADYVFIVDPWWNPAAEMQAIDRTHRIGQKNKVFVYKIITKNSIEEKILQMQEDKMEVVKNIIVPDESIFKKLDMKEINHIFE